MKKTEDKIKNNTWDLDMVILEVVGVFLKKSLFLRCKLWFLGFYLCLWMCFDGCYFCKSFFYLRIFIFLI